ncbi:MAG: alpha/beta hydrolase family protein [Marinifilaceae bacterium]
MRIILLLICNFTIVLASAMAEAKTIDSAAYMMWKRIDNFSMSENAEWIIYKYQYIDNDSLNVSITNQYHIYNNHTGKKDIIDNVTYPSFINNGQYLIYRRATDDQYEIYNLKSKARQSLENFVSVDYTSESPTIIGVDSNNIATFYNLNTGKKNIISGYFNYRRTDNNGNMLALSKNELATSLHYFNIEKSEKSKIIYSDTTKTLRYFSYNEKHKKGEFKIEHSNSKIKSYIEYSFTTEGDICPIFNSTTVQSNLPIRSYRPLSGDKLIELTMAENRTTKKYNTPKDTSFQIELWSWNDYKIPSEQEISGYREKRLNADVHIYNLNNKQSIQLTNNQVASVYYPKVQNIEYALIVDETPYVTQKDWLYVSRYDNYIVNLNTNVRDTLSIMQSSRPMWAPNNNFLVSFNKETMSWEIYNPLTKERRNLQNEIPFPQYNELHDRPFPAAPYGIAGWGKNNNLLYIYDRFDIWCVDLSQKTPTYCITNNYGRQNEVRIRFNSEDPIDDIDPNKRQAITLNYWRTKEQALGWLERNGKITEKFKQFATFRKTQQSSNQEWYLIDKQSFNEGRDLWIYNSVRGSMKRVSNANPNHNNFKWGRVELVEWTNYAGKLNQGVLYLPHNYDKNKKYPTIVSFYETHSNEIHAYFPPMWSSAMLNIPTYLSQDYIIFQPDVYFQVGNPGKSSYDAVVSGTQALINRGIIDSTCVGLQGHSWSGYQVSYLVTQTNLFTCVNIGAAITNMVGAYTGIREGSGVPRMFMYEDWQCRMGQTLWENKDAYINNSAIYFADRIKTPALIFHCDKDEAVSFSDGRNLFLALRRLQRPAWMINYKGEGHFVNSLGARMDWTKRMNQFFDYYLKNTQIPRWMDEGISIKESGYDPKLDLIHKL